MTDPLNKASFLAQLDATIERLMHKKYLSAKHVADALSIHPQKLYRHIKQVVGMSSSEYITKYRIEYAKRLLLMYDMLAIVNIGYMCGFDEPTHFNRFFNRVTGMTPREFRKTTHNAHYSFLVIFLIEMGHYSMNNSSQLCTQKSQTCTS